jgi:hypothetical protein
MPDGRPGCGRAGASPPDGDHRHGSARPRAAEAKEQEFNVRYVIETRAKRTLNIANLDNLTEPH